METFSNLKLNFFLQKQKIIIELLIHFSYYFYLSVQCSLTNEILSDIITYAINNVKKQYLPENIEFYVKNDLIINSYKDENKQKLTMQQIVENKLDNVHIDIINPILKINVELLLFSFDDQKETNEQMTNYRVNQNEDLLIQKFNKEEKIEQTQTTLNIAKKLNSLFEQNYTYLVARKLQSSNVHKLSDKEVALITESEMQGKSVPAEFKSGKSQLDFQSQNQAQSNKQTQKQWITLEQVAIHNKPDDAWMIINNQVYDITEYAKIHPGGKQILFENAGKDGTQKFSQTFNC